MALGNRIPHGRHVLGTGQFPQKKTNQINPPSQKKNNSLTIPPPFYFPFFPIDNPFYAQSRSPSRLPKIPTIPPHQFEFKLEQEYLLLAKKKTCSNLVRSERFTAKSQICDSVALECHGECMVFFVDWAGWYVIISLSFFFFLSFFRLLFLFLSFGGGFVETNTSKKQKVLFFFLWTKLQLTDYGTSGTELSLTVPITNSLAFLFTVLGEWWADGKVISRGKLHTFHTEMYPLDRRWKSTARLSFGTLGTLHDVFAMMREVQAATGTKID